MLQLAGVKVKELVTEASVASLAVRESRTSLVGWALSTTVKVSVVPDSFTEVDPPDSATVNPGISLSVVVTVTVWSAKGSKLSFEDPSLTEMVTVEV